jgi:hypothetical protein
VHVETHMQHIDMAAEAQRDLQCLIENGLISFAPIDAGKDMLDAAML